MDAKQLGTVRRLADFGRSGIAKPMAVPFPNLGSLLRSADEMRRNGDISLADEFFALATVLNGGGLGAEHNKDFLQQLAVSAAQLSVILEREPASSEAREAKTFDRARRSVEKFIMGHWEEALIKARKDWARGKLAETTHLINQATDYKIAAESLPPKLTNADISLALCWCPPETRRLYGRESDPGASQTPHLPYTLHRDFHLGLTLSARTAEKAAAGFYRQYDRSVEDVSITQLEGKNERWRLYDFTVGGHGHVDVKNSRRSKTNHNSYVEHCVPKFKLHREGHDVIIFGVLSDYLIAHEIVPDYGRRQTGPVLCLGETTLRKQVSLKEEFEDSHLLEINFSRLGQGTRQFIPPWMFDYPDFAYEERDAALAELGRKGIPPTGLWEEAGTEVPLAVLIAAGLDLSHYWSGLESWEQDLCTELSERRNRLGLSLPVVFLSLLKHFLGMATAQTGDVEDFSPAGYRKAIFHRWQNKPLCIYDPLQTVNSLIDSLDVLWRAEHGLIREFRQFRLQGFNILQGRADTSAQWKTLIAYCGGWISFPYGGGRKCGRTPLLLGQSQNCQLCGKLICPDCGYCSDGCGRRKDQPVPAMLA